MNEEDFDKLVNKYFARARLSANIIDAMRFMRKEMYKELNLIMPRISPYEDKDIDWKLSYLVSRSEIWRLLK